MHENLDINVSNLASWKFQSVLEILTTTRLLLGDNTLSVVIEAFRENCLDLFVEATHLNLRILFQLSRILTPWKKLQNKHFPVFKVNNVSKENNINLICRQWMIFRNKELPGSCHLWHKTFNIWPSSILVLEILPPEKSQAQTGNTSNP